MAIPFALSEFVDNVNAGNDAIPIYASRKVNLNGTYLLKLKGVSLSCNLQTIDPQSVTVINLNYFFNLRAAEMLAGPVPNLGYVFHLDQNTMITNSGASLKLMSNQGLLDTTIVTNIQGFLNFQLTSGRGQPSSVVNYRKPNAYIDTSIPINIPLSANPFFMEGSIIFVFEYEKVEIN